MAEMFGWPAHPDDDQVGTFIAQVEGRDYDAARRTLEAIERIGRVEVTITRRWHDLLQQALRLAEDQERLAEVTAGLASAEEHTQGELQRLAASTSTPGPQPLTVDGPPNQMAQNRDVPDTPSISNTTRSGQLRIHLLGSCRFDHQGGSLDGGNGDRAAEILRFLAAQPETGVHKEQLTARFWPDADERSSRRCLHQVIYNIRRRLQTIGADHELRFVNDHYRLGSETRWRDVDELESAMVAARRACDDGHIAGHIAACQRVNELYTGDFLADQPYAEWAEADRRYYRTLYREATEALLDHWDREGRLSRVVELAERLLVLDPADESACRRLMNAQRSLGHPQLAAVAFIALTESLSDLGLTPSDETRSLARRVCGRTAAMSDV